VDNRKGRCFILQQVAGHVNKRARHYYTDQLRAGLIDFLNQFVTPEFDEEEEEHFRTIGYDIKSKCQIQPPEITAPKK
jgi:hypothetical protein